MLERFKRSSDDPAASRTGAVATAERDGDTAYRDGDTAYRDGAVDGDRTTRSRTGNGAATATALATARARQREEFGGINWGSSFFGWLVAVGVGALLTSLLIAAGAAIGLTATTDSTSSSTAKDLSLAGAIALLAVLMIAYYAGGYVAGRMSRFDGARQGLATWAIGVAITVTLAVAGVILGSEYNVLERLNLPALPVGDTSFASGGLIALAAILIGTLIAATSGGKVGERYHKRVDRAGFVD
jgi:hypothetical protein